MKTIAINCQAATSIPLADLVPLQGALKELSNAAFEKLKESILRHGITFPLHVWRSGGVNWILDGCQRDRVLTRMKAEGYDVPPLPCALIDAKDKKEAAEKILLISSSYGRMTDEGLYAFLNENEIDFAALEPLLDLPQIDLNEFKAAYLTDPLFGPASADEQGRLDQKAPVVCPSCGARFVP